MRKEKLNKAIQEARRFIKRAEIAVDEIVAFQKDRNVKWEPCPSRKFSATKRASLDLSAVLVELRKGE